MISEYEIALTVERIMNGMGFPPTASGPFVSALRKKTTDEVVMKGLRSRHTSFEPEAELLTYDERAKAILAWEWAMERGHSYKQKCFAPPVGWRFVINHTGRRHTEWRIYIRWNRLLPWFGDRIRQIGMKWRVFRDKRILKLRNPYEQQ